jgi:hypothetical protein
MKKANVLKHVPNLKGYKKDIKAKQNEIEKIQAEADELIAICNELEGVVIHADNPIVTEENTNPDRPSFEAWAAFDESERYAYASRDSDDGVSPERWRATGYKHEGDAEGKVLVEGVNRLAAIRAAKDYAATGKVNKPVTKDAKASKKTSA